MNLIFVKWVVVCVQAILLLGAFGLIVYIRKQLAMLAKIDPRFVNTFTETVNARKYKEAYEMARKERSLLGRILTAGMARFQFSFEDGRKAAFMLADSIQHDFKSGLNYGSSD